MIYGTVKEAEGGLLDIVRALVDKNTLRRIIDAMMSIEETVKSEIADEIE